MEWLDKYAPTSVSQIIGPRKAPEDLLKWLKEWKSGGRFKSAVVTGPPGCGKTVLARVACAEAGVGHVLELNCSSKRTKKAVADFKEAFLVRSLLSFLPRSRGVSSSGRPGAVIIDEMDACDSGGLGELIKCIRTSSVPVVCIAGDGYCKPLKPLIASSLHLRMLRPSADQVGGRLMMIAQLEGAKPSLSQGSARALAAACNCDVRQAVIELYMATRGGVTLALARNVDGLLCDRPLGAFDVIPKLFVPDAQRNGGFPASCERLYMSDRSLVPLMVGENYHRASPAAVDLERLAAAADAVSCGNMVEGYMYRGGAWELVDVHAFASTAMPCAIAGGPMAARVEFPEVLARASALSAAQRRLGETVKRCRSVANEGSVADRKSVV